MVDGSDPTMLVITRRIGETLILKKDEEIIAKITTFVTYGLARLSILLTKEHPLLVSIQDYLYTISDSGEFVASAEIVRFTSNQMRCLIKAFPSVKIHRLENLCPKCGEIMMKFPHVDKQKPTLLMSCANCQSTYLVNPYACENPTQLNISYMDLLKKFGIPDETTDRKQIKIILKNRN